MGKHSHIEWTDHTFNPWWGCSKVSPACQHCYAETLTVRFGGATWGARGQRRFFGPEHWREPVKWNQEAERQGRRFRVFCASMADVYEDRADLLREREKLWNLIERTPSLDWLLLTKRPENVEQMSPWGKRWPANVWLGASVENQEWAEKRIPVLCAIPAKIRFLSCEPLLGPLSLSNLIKGAAISWIIAGGESGHGARPMKPDWVRDLRDFCSKKGVAFHFKQWGHWAPISRSTVGRRVRFEIDDDTFEMAGLGKGVSGREIDGRTHDAFPVEFPLRSI